MRIHTNSLTLIDLRKAAGEARVTLLRSNEHGSRKRARAFDVILGGNSHYRVNSRGYGTQGQADYLGDEYAATWDQWGIFLGSLFEADPELWTPYYSTAEEFHWVTCGRFDRFDYEETRVHRLHKWEFQGQSMGGLYVVHKCKGSKSFGECDAQQHRLTRGTWEQFAAL